MKDAAADLFDPPPRARNTDPETSHEAAESMVETAASQRERILARLRRFGPCTADHLDHELGLRPTSAGRRLPEIEEQGRAHKTDRKAITRSGRRATIWAHGPGKVVRRREDASEDPKSQLVRLVAQETIRACAERSPYTSVCGADRDEIVGNVMAAYRAGELVA